MDTPSNYSLAYYGKELAYFKIAFANIILSIITLGLYYPWAKAASLRYHYSKTSFDGSPFQFSGTGEEMFKGFIKAIALFVGVIICTMLIPYLDMQLKLLVPYLVLFFLSPYIIHGSYRYRMAKSSWKGIRLGYTGDRKKLAILFYKGFFFTLITLGIYGSWFTISLRRYILGNIKLGNASFEYHGEGGDYFWLNIKCYFLTFFTLGIYSFWWQKELFAFFVNHLRLTHEGKEIRFSSNATGMSIALLTISNFVIILFTLGLGFPWVIVRSLRYFLGHISLEGDIPLETLEQSQGEFNDATADDASDLLDFGFVI